MKLRPVRRADSDGTACDMAAHALLQDGRRWLTVAPILAKEGRPVLRVRFHGRGGHGVKTASRILGTAGFRNGLQAQDCPVYGAERRGAAVAAYTRLDADPIAERGPVAEPDLILVADETLLADPAAGVLVGGAAAAVFVNASERPLLLTGPHGPAPSIISLDLTALTTELLGCGSALSAALGAAACALAGLQSVESLVGAVREELAELELAPELIERNVEVARRVHVALPAVPLRERSAPRTAAVLHAPAYLGVPAGVPVILAAGNSTARHTGAWRLVRPVIDRDACTRCGFCFALCPDGVLARDANGYPVIDDGNCKGCLICANECPLRCIHVEKEVRAW